ncbi:peptidyl-prolyl cis-trans isomerase FKBP53 isoform X2 [Andrographis paniculata]|uniref:peptidyl-prolyl cis-trans isomerase FKBP53 isoform X2 n=1 Tax=Andrographis paniculata TaxID=175694 RepID=UPI0021E91E39|nr:peptidyl-prolyl cis-trans isomerase FKBP53 isoform X2 [Andrographis paniculata]
MAFWGVEVKPGKPYIHRSDERGRLHLSQATLSSCSSGNRTVLQCIVGDKNPINLCSLFPKKLENCALNLEFEEDDEVTFLISGSDRVHLSGFFYGVNEDQDTSEDDYDYGSYEEGIVGTDSEDEEDYMEYDSKEYESDDYTEPAPNSGVRIVEIIDDGRPSNENDVSKQVERQKPQLTMPDDNETANCQIVLKAKTNDSILESEDEDGFPISVHGEKSGNSKSEARTEEIKHQEGDVGTHKNNEKGDVGGQKKLKEKIKANDQDGEAARENSEPHDSSVQPDATTTIPANEGKQKKKNKKRKAAENIEGAQENAMPNSKVTEESPVAANGNDPDPSSANKKEKKKKKKQNKEQESVPTPNAEGNLTDKKAPVSKKQKKEEAKSFQVRTFPNGLVIEELVMGKPDGKRASPGKKVSVHYIGKLKNNKIFDSNIGRTPFTFRLGVGQVIKGWDVGVNGMRIGDKRRLTIPPAMGYGSSKAGKIPPNSWLIFDVELRQFYQDKKPNAIPTITSPKIVEKDTRDSSGEEAKVTIQDKEENLPSGSMHMADNVEEFPNQEDEQDDDELRKRVEEFIEKINSGWKAEKLVT